MFSFFYLFSICLCFMFIIYYIHFALSSNVIHNHIFYIIYIILRCDCAQFQSFSKLVFLVFLFVLNRTRYGRGIYAIGGNKQTAYLAGIPVKRYLILTYALGGLCFAIAGVLLCGRLGMGTATVGDGYEMDAIASVVIGGASMNGGSGSVVKTIVGAMLMGVLYNIMNLMGVASYPQMVLKGIVIVLAVLLYKTK